MRIGDQLAEVYHFHEGLDKNAAIEKARESLRRVAIPDPEATLRRYPFELSGGQQQRVVIAMALSVNPRLLILDEPTTGLDATVEAEILDLIDELRGRINAAILLITHNLGLVARLCERVGVLYAGRLVEEGPARDIFTDPRHPYTMGLFRCVPRFGMNKTDAALQTIPGTLPALGEPLAGCVYSARCPMAKDVCVRREPDLYAYPGEAARRAARRPWPWTRTRPPTRRTTRTLWARARATRAATSPPKSPRCRRWSPCWPPASRSAAPARQTCSRSTPSSAPSRTGARGSPPCTRSRWPCRRARPSASSASRVRARPPWPSASPASSPPTQARSSSRVVRCGPRRRSARRTPSGPSRWCSRTRTPHSTRRGRRAPSSRAPCASWAARGAAPCAPRSTTSQPGCASSRASSSRSRWSSPAGRSSASPSPAPSPATPRSSFATSPPAPSTSPCRPASSTCSSSCRRRRRSPTCSSATTSQWCRYISDRIGVMYLAELIEVGSSEEVFSAPHHPYTEALLSSIPKLDFESPSQRIPLRGTMPSLSDPPSGLPLPYPLPPLPRRHLRDPGAARAGDRGRPHLRLPHPAGRAPAAADRDHGERRGREARRRHAGASGRGDGGRRGRPQRRAKRRLKVRCRERPPLRVPS